MDDETKEPKMTKMPDSHDIKLLNARIEHLEQYRFGSFVTYTLRKPFRYEYSPYRFFKLQRVFNTHVLNLNDRLIGRNYRKNEKRVSLIYVIDWDSGNGVHIHALFEEMPEMNLANYPFPEIVKYEWNKVHAMTGQVDYKEYDPDKKAIAYLCGKELTKGYEVIYDYFRSYY